MRILAGLVGATLMIAAVQVPAGAAESGWTRGSNEFDMIEDPQVVAVHGDRTGDARTSGLDRYQRWAADIVQLTVEQGHALVGETLTFTLQARYRDPAVWARVRLTWGGPTSTRRAATILFQPAHGRFKIRGDITRSCARTPPLWRHTGRDAKFALGTSCFQSPARAYRIRYETITPNRKVLVRDTTPWSTTPRMELARFRDESVLDTLDDVNQNSAASPRPDLDLGEVHAMGRGSLGLIVWVRDPSTEPEDPDQVFRIVLWGDERRGLVGQANRSGTSTSFTLTPDPDLAPWACTAEAYFDGHLLRVSIPIGPCGLTASSFYTQVNAESGDVFFPATDSVFLDRIWLS